MGMEPGPPPHPSGASLPAIQEGPATALVVLQDPHRSKGSRG